MTFPDLSFLPQDLRDVASLSLGLRPNLDELVVNGVREIAWIFAVLILHVVIKLELRLIDKICHGFEEECTMAFI